MALQKGGARAPCAPMLDPPMNIAVISLVLGAAEDSEITAILYEHARDLTGFYPVH